MSEVRILPSPFDGGVAQWQSVGTFSRFRDLYVLFRKPCEILSPAGVYFGGVDDANQARTQRQKLTNTMQVRLLPSRFGM